MSIVFPDLLYISLERVQENLFTETIFEISSEVIASNNVKMKY